MLTSIGTLKDMERHGARSKACHRAGAWCWCATCGGGVEKRVHLGELGARRSDLLDAELVQLSLELVELLEELILILAPEGSGLDFAGGLFSRQKVSIGS